ncbi:MAG: alpha/beta fold hydrolase [Gallionella sp.]
MVALHVEESGSGEPLLLIHGWGMHGGMWGSAVERLARDFRVIAVDLPGHGFSGKGEGRGDEAREGIREKGDAHPAPAARPSLPGGLPFPLPPSPFSLEDIVDALSAQFSEPLNLCGWSLGGQIALRWAARHPQQVRRLVLVTSTPCFVRQPGWDCAMAADMLAGFAAALEQNYALTLRRFLALQVRGSENERELLASLRSALFSRGEPELAALQAGLNILRDCDLRDSLPQIVQPALVIAGERDTLTPPDASRHLAERMPQARLVLVEGAAHAPFLSHPDRFVACIKDFLEERT